MTDEKKTQIPDAQAIAEGAEVTKEMVQEYTSQSMDTDKMWITMGPQHPFSHGLWTLKIQADGEIVTDADPIVGYLHRG